MPSVPQHVRKSLSNLPLGRLSGRRDHMNRIVGNVRWGATRVGLLIVIVGAIVVAFSLPAGANTGFVTTSQTCYTWSAAVFLNNDDNLGYYVEVSSTIPGTT